MKHIERGRVLNVAETVARFPLVDRRDLRGAGVWYDVTMVQSQRVLIEILHWACSLGATALNYVEATGLVKGTSGISAVEARDAMSGAVHVCYTAGVQLCRALEFRRCCAIRRPRRSAIPAIARFQCVVRL